MGGFQSFNLWQVQCNINVNNRIRRVVLLGPCNESDLLSGLAFVKVSTSLTAAGVALCSLVFGCRRRIVVRLLVSPSH